MKFKFYCIKEKLYSLITMVILFLSTQSFALSTSDDAVLSGRIKAKQSGNYLIPVNIYLNGSTDILIKGQVTDVNGEAIPGVSVKVLGSTVGTTTDLDGRFTVNVADNNSILVFTYIGFLTQEIAVTNRSSINVKLEKSNKALGEIVVIGYGTQKKVNLTGSISVVDAKTIENRPLTSSSQALQGVQGIYVNQAGGQPGRDGATIRIRGIGSIGGSGKLEPLVMVDGVEYSLNDVNPSDIESISVLKDAASTSIYGSRAANGVILVTTKKGKAGQTSIDYNNYLGLEETTYLPDPVVSSVDFMEGYNAANVNAGGAKYYSDALIASFRSNPTSDIYPNTNWMDLMFNRAFMQEHNLRFAGGTDKTKYNLSVGYLDQEGVLMGTEAKKYSANLRMSSQLNDRLSIDGSILGTFRDIIENNGGTSTAMNRLMRMVPMQPSGRFDDGRWPDSRVLTPGQNSFENPLIRAKEGFRNEKTSNLLASLSLKFKVLTGLNFETKASYNKSDALLEQFTPLIWLHDPITGLRTRTYSSASTRFSSYSNSPSITIFNTLTYNKKIGENHDFSVLAGQSFQRFKAVDFNAQIQGLPSNDLTELNIGTLNPSVGGASTISALLSYFGRLQYSFKDKYLFEGNFRYDGSSRFYEDNRWGFFPSLSLGWRVGQESFMQNITWVDELKVRGSWGQIGNQEIGMFQFVNAVDLGSNYAFGGSIAPGAAVNQSRDPDVSWETTTITNIGLDWSLFNNKLNGVAEVFRKRTDGILRTVAIPSQVGNLTGPTTNIATVDNIGFEIALSHKNKISKSFSYEIGGQITKVRNEVIDLKGETIFSGNNITKVGTSINDWYLYKTAGLFQTQQEVNSYPRVSVRVGPGDIKYLDIDGNGVIDGNDRYNAGSSLPEFTYGFNLGITVKGIQLATFWQGVAGINVYPDFNLASPFNNGAGLEKRWLTDAWTPQNTNATLPRITIRNTYTENFLPSDFYLQDASYLRLKNVQLSYPISGNFLNNIGIKQLTFFTNAQNLLTFSKFKMYDPERNILSTNLSEYPSVKMVTLGLNVKF